MPLTRVRPALEAVPDVVRQHVEEAATLFTIRTALVDAPHVPLRDLRRFDERIAAHFDGLAASGAFGWSLCDAALQSVTAGTVFTVAVRALEDRKPERLERLFALVEAVPEAVTGLLSAFGWVDRQFLQGVVVDLVRSEDRVRRLVGVGACAMHRVEPLRIQPTLLDDDDLRVRAGMLRALGELGHTNAQQLCTDATTDHDPACRFWAAWSAVLLGDRNRAARALTAAALSADPHRTAALRLVLQTLQPSAGHELLQALAGNGALLPILIEGSGIVGNPAYVRWLVGRMADPQTARRAGEAFSLITGADLEQLDLEQAPPDNFESGPNDDPDDGNVDMDPDDGLAWPNVAKIDAWWATNSSRFQEGQRYFLGKPVTREHCIEVLKGGYQRQRLLAAHYLCLLEPGTPLFNTGAPAWRQLRLLANIT